MYQKRVQFLTNANLTCEKIVFIKFRMHVIQIVYNIKHISTKKRRLACDRSEKDI